MSEYQSEKLPDITVIVRAFQAEQFIRAAIDSVIGQDYKGTIKVLILYDKGSSDGTLDFLNTLDTSIPNRDITIIKHDHTSPFLSLVDHGFTRIETDYVAILDYDNYYEKDYLRRIIEFAERNQLPFTFSIPNRVDENGVKGDPLFRINNKFGRRKLSEIIRNHIDTNGMFLSKDSVEIITDYLSRTQIATYEWVHEDWLIGIIAYFSFKFPYFKYCGVNYRFHDNNTAARSKNANSTPPRIVNNNNRRLLTMSAFNLLLGDKFTRFMRILFVYSLVRRNILQMRVAWSR